jgi:hypothetical protein
MKLGTIKQELALCRAAFKDSKVGDYAWCVHHEILFESLTEPAEERIKHILSHKPREEQARRLHEFRLVKVKLPSELAAACAKWAAACAKWAAARAKCNAASDKWDAASDKWDAASDKWDAARAKWDAASAKYDAARAKWAAALEILHKAECPDSTWNGTTILAPLVDSQKRTK